MDNYTIRERERKDTRVEREETGREKEQEEERYLQIICEEGSRQVSLLKSVEVTLLPPPPPVLLPVSKVTYRLQLSLPHRRTSRPEQQMVQ